MREAMRERRPVNYSEAQQDAALAKALGEGRKSRKAEGAGAEGAGNGKENRKRAGASEAVAVGPPAKKPARDAANDAAVTVSDDPVEGNSDSGEDNVFRRFKRPTAPIGRTQAAKPKSGAAASGRPARAAAARGAAAAANAAAEDEDEDDDEDDGGAVRTARVRGRREVPRQQQQQRPSRAAAAATKERIRHAAATAGRDRFEGDGSDSMEDDDDDEEEEAQQAIGKRRSARADDRAQGSDGSGDGSSGSESEDEDEEEDERPVRGRRAAPAPPPRAASGRAAAHAAAQRLARGAPGGQDGSSSGSDSGSEEERDVQVTEQGRRGRAAPKRAAPRRRASDGSESHASSSSSEDEDESESESEDDEEEGEDKRASGQGGDAAQKKDKEEGAAKHSKAARADGDGSGDVVMVGDSDTGNSDSDEEEGDEEGDEEDDEEEETARRRGRAAPAAAPKAKTGAKDKRTAKGAAKDKAAGKDKGKGRGAAAKAAPKAKPAAAKAGGGAGKGRKRREGVPEEPIERILSYDADAQVYVVKLEGVSYRRPARVTRDVLEELRPHVLRIFEARGCVPVEVEEGWTQVERVVASRPGRQQGRAGRQLLVKWKGLEYGESTWEDEADLASEQEKESIARFERFNARPSKDDAAAGRGSVAALRRADFALPDFRNGRALRDYQQVSVRWMVNNFTQHRNCILGDEMGLGKTAQSVSTLETLRRVGGVRGPFLVVAPLSTLPHWQREIETWTDMNVVLLAGGAADRATIVEHEFYRDGGAGAGGRKGGGRRDREVKFDVLLASYDMLLRERGLLRSIAWAAAVFDEAHRLKGLNSSTRETVEEMTIGWLLLLTGTPIQNNMLELFSILSLLDPAAYPSPDDFNDRFGGIAAGSVPTLEQIKRLQEALAPVLLRRMKEDVEELPQKEEVIIHVELTALQRAYYRATYAGQIGALLGGGGGGRALPQMRNLAMELRKLCCHPVLCEGLEEDLRGKLQAAQAAGAEAAQAYTCFEQELLVRGSGKMLLLHKLLPKLRAEGRRVLIFSQFVIMLNVLEDYCRVSGYPVERIDGTVRGRDRQAAIDRFSADGGEGGNEHAFVFLLSTRAGGQGITLTAADTCIIYDSDWNPQNDLQAMARCHRIGQKKDVTVYRLLSRDTYEMAVFGTASRKYGLGEAVCGFNASDPEADSAQIAQLLRNGAHGLAEGEAGAARGDEFAAEDINQILAGRTEKRQIGSRAGNTFSVATFVVEQEDPLGPEGGGAGASGSGAGGTGTGTRRGGRGTKAAAAAAEEKEKEYWRAICPEAVAAHEARAAEGGELVVLGPRKRAKVNYNVDAAARAAATAGAAKGAGKGKRGGKGGSSSAADGSDSDSDSDASDGKRSGGGEESSSEDDDADGGGAGGKGGEAGAKRGRGGGGRRRVSGQWTKADAHALEERLLGLGPDRWSDLHATMEPTRHSLSDVEAAGRALWGAYELAAQLNGDKSKRGTLIQQQLQTQLEAVRKRVAAAAPPPPPRGAGDDAEDFARMLDDFQRDDELEEKVGSDPEAVALRDKAQAARDALQQELEQRLAKHMQEALPAGVYGALGTVANLRRLLNDGPAILRHGAVMRELYDLVHPEGARAKKQAAEAQEGGGKDGQAAPYVVGYVAAAGLPAWWGRAEDGALLLAAAQVGYTVGRPRRTVEHALRSQALSSRVVLAATPAAPAEGAAEAAAASGEAGGPQQLALDAWRQLLQAVGRRVAKLISTTLDLNRKTDAAKRPLPVTARPQPPPAPASNGAGPSASAKPAAAPAPQQQPKPAAAPAPAKAAPALPAKPAAPKPAAAPAAPSGAAAAKPVAAPSAAARPAPAAAPPPGRPAAGAAAGAAAAAGAGPSDPSPQTSPAKGSAAASAGASKGKHSLKQSTLPFAKLASKQAAAPAAAAGNGDAKAGKVADAKASLRQDAKLLQEAAECVTAAAEAAAVALRAATPQKAKKAARRADEPGSAEKPIVLE